MISARIFAPRFFAEIKLSSITIAAPSPNTNPSLLAVNGLDAVCGLSFLVDRAVSRLNPVCPGVNHRVCAACNHNICVAPANHHCRLTGCLGACRAGSQAASYRSSCTGEHRQMHGGHIRFLLQLVHRPHLYRRDVGPFCPVHNICLVIPAGGDCAKERLVIRCSFARTR